MVRNTNAPLPRSTWISRLSMPGFEQEETEGTETSLSVIYVCSCSKIFIAELFQCVSRFAHHPAMRDSGGKRAKKIAGRKRRPNQTLISSKLNSGQATFAMRK